MIYVTGKVKPKATFFSSLLSCTDQHFGISAIGGTLAGLGANILPTRGKFGGATPGTSIASTLSRDALSGVKIPFKVYAPTFAQIGRAASSLTSGAGAETALRELTLTAEAGTIVGRWVPIVGWGLLAYGPFEKPKDLEAVH